MHVLAHRIISVAAHAAGLPENSIFAGAVHDNLTLPRPRCEISLLPEQYSRTGKKLGIQRSPESGQQCLTRELYSVALDAQARFFATDAEWLERFGVSFVAALMDGARGAHDSAGNWVEVRVQNAALSSSPEAQLGTARIQVLPKAEKTYTIRFISRITHKEYQNLICDVRIGKPAFHSDGTSIREKKNGIDNAG